MSSISNSVCKRNGLIELCRFIFAMCIVCHHALFLSNPEHIPLSGGYIAVEFFFILTGFFMCKDALKKPAEHGGMTESLKRLKTIYPYFFVSWGTSFIISHIYNKCYGIGAILRDFLRGIPQLLFLSMPGLGGDGWTMGLCRHRLVYFSDVCCNINCVSLDSSFR